MNLFPKSSTPLQKTPGVLPILTAAAILLCAEAFLSAETRQSTSAVVPSQSGEASASGETPPAPAPKRPRPQIHRVWIWQESKDCLWSLSKKYYGDPWQWKKIYLANRNDILDPDVVFPKQALIIPSRDE